MKTAIDPVDNGLMYCYAKRGEFMASLTQGMRIGAVACVVLLRVNAMVCC